MKHYSLKVTFFTSVTKEHIVLPRFETFFVEEVYYSFFMVFDFLPCVSSWRASEQVSQKHAQRRDRHQMQPGARCCRPSGRFRC